jgi:hypothetical protein
MWLTSTRPSLWRRTRSFRTEVVGCAQAHLAPYGATRLFAGAAFGLGLGPATPHRLMRGARRLPLQADPLSPMCGPFGGERCVRNGGLSREAPVILQQGGQDGPIDPRRVRVLLVDAATG